MARVLVPPFREDDCSYRALEHRFVYDISSALMREAAVAGMKADQLCALLRPDLPDEAFRRHLAKASSKCWVDMVAIVGYLMVGRWERAHFTLKDAIIIADERFDDLDVRDQKHLRLCEGCSNYVRFIKSARPRSNQYLEGAGLVEYIESRRPSTGASGFDEDNY